MTMKLNRTAGRKLLSLLLTLCVMLSLLPAITPTARAGNVSKRTNALDLSGAYLTYQTGSGTAVANPTAQDIDAAAEGWSWAFGTKTLTLSGVDFGGIEYVVLPGNSTIVLTGGSTNTLIPVGTQVVKYGIYCGGNLTVRGAGSLEVAGVAGGTESRALWLAGTLTIEDGTLDFHGESAQSGSYGIYAGGSVVITGGYLLTSGDSSNNGGYGIFASQSISVAGGTVTAKGNYALQAISGIVLTGMSAMQKDTYLGYCVPVSVGGGMLQYSGGMIATDVLITPSPVSAAISDLTLSGGVGIALTGTNEVALTLSGATFSGVSANNVVSSWFTNLPAGLVATVDTVAGDETTVTVVFSGTPTTASGEVMAITIPGGMLSMGANVAVTSNNNAKFAVTQPTAARTSGLDLTASTVAYLDQYGTSVSANPTAESITDTGEGWAWYLTATGDYAAKTLVLSGIDLSTPEITGLKLPAGATIVLAEGSVNTVVSVFNGSGTNETSRGVLAVGELTIQGDGTLDVTGGTSNGSSGDSAGLATTTTNAHLTIKDGAVVNATSGTAARNSWGIYAMGRLNSTNATVTSIGGDGQSYSMGIQAVGDIVVSGSSGAVTAKAGVSPNRRSVQSLLGSSILTPLMQVRQWNEGENAYSTEVTVGSAGTGSQVTYMNGSNLTDNVRIVPLPVSFHGEGTVEAPYLIGTKAQLEEMEVRVNADPDTYSDKHYALTADIVLNEDLEDEPEQWNPIGTSYSQAFKGVFDGQGHTITGLYIDGDITYAGLFGRIEEGTVRNVGLVDGQIVSSRSYGYAGAVAGYIFDGTIEDCYNTGSVWGAIAGGIAGCNGGHIQDSYNTGFVLTNVSAPGAQCYAGGIAGQNLVAEDTIVNCYNTGSVSASLDTNSSGYVGGIAGLNEKSTIKNCYSAGALPDSAANLFVGGIAGKNTDHLSSVIEHVYWLATSAKNIAGINGGTSTGTGLQDSDMKASFLVTWLNTQLSELAGIYPTLSSWRTAPVDKNGGYPVFGTPLPALSVPANLDWRGTTASWDAVDNAASYSVQLYRGETAVGEVVSVTSGTVHDFASVITVAGSYTFKVTAVGNGEINADSAASAASEAQNYHSVTYWANDGATGSVPVDRKVYASGATVTVRGNPGGLARPGYTFSGWSDGEPTYTAGQTFAISRNTILYTSWTVSAATHTVTFMDNYPGGSTFLTRNDIQTGALLSGLSAPSRADYTFTGWYRDAACMIPWDTGMAVTANLTLYAGWTANPLHSVSGHVENTSGGNVSGATVRIFKGNTQIGNTAATLTDGSFTVSNVPDGAYNVVVKKDDQQVTHFITVSGGDYTFSGSIVLPDGKKNSVLDIVGTDTPPVVANGVNELFTDSSIFDSTDADIVSGSGTVEIRLTVQPSEDTAGQTTVQAAISSGGYSSGTLLDLELTKTSTDAGGNVQTQTAINETTDPLTLIIPLPAALQGKANYVIYRAHDHGSGLIADAITTTANASGEYIAVNSEKTQITLYAKFFSTYVIAYSTGSSETPTTGGSGTSYRVTVEGTLIGGSISPSGSISVAKGGSKTFTITPDKGYVISDVLVDGKSVGAVSSYTLSNITAAHALSAVFAKATGLPYYYVDDSKVFIGFASDDSGEMKYLAPEGETVLFVPNPKDFTDISGHWGKDAIDFVTQREIFMGTGTNVFSPDTGMTRAMLATVIGRLYERSYGTLTTTGAQSFADCDYNSWYGAYIDWCAEQGIIQGVGGDQFEPDRQVTRQEMAAMLYRFAEFLEVNESGLDGETLGYSDAASIADWAQAAALYCQETGIITGRNGGSFAPAQTATRVEVATILERFIELVV